jgi:hypothetical protein
MAAMVAGDLGVLARPRRSAARRGLVCVPPGIGHDGDSVSPTATTLRTPFMPATEAASKLFSLPPHRALLDRGVQHTRQLDVDAVDLFARDLFARVQPWIGLPAIVQVFGSFSAGSFGTSSLAAAAATLP